MDTASVEAAALLHDVDKVPVARQPGIRHGDGSAAWLEANGLAELAPLVRDHPVTRLANDTDARRLAAAPLEARIVAYADKREASGSGRWTTGSPRGATATRPARPTAVRRRRASRREARLGHGTSAGSYARALDLERGDLQARGHRPDVVGRLRWARRAIAEAAA